MQSRGPWRHRGSNERGMSSVELVVCICIMAVAAAAFIPGYITYTQQSRVLALVLPRLQQLESNIALFYLFEKKLPADRDLQGLMEGVSNENLVIDLANGVVTLTVAAPDSDSRMHILDGAAMVASPVIGPAGITAWHLDGELTDRLGLGH